MKVTFRRQYTRVYASHNRANVFILANRRLIVRLDSEAEFMFEKATFIIYYEIKV